MKATLKFLQNFYSPLHKKTFTASDPKKNTIEIDVDEDGLPLHSFWFSQLDSEKKEQEEAAKQGISYTPYFELQLQVTIDNKSKKAK